MDNNIPGSFRDPDGFLFVVEGIIYRQINNSYADTYEKIVKSGLYEHLWEKKMLIPHELVSIDLSQTEIAFAVIKPQQVPFISYPYEWSFEQLKDAALLTLEIQRQAMSFGFSLKDASAYNIQFVNGRPVFIDTLSFEISKPGKPWVAYHQFCKHFLAPLLLMTFVDIRLASLLQTNIDGIPLDLASRLLPTKTLIRPSTLFHIHLHSRMQAKYADSQRTKKKKATLSKNALPILIDNLTSAIKRLRWKLSKTEWSDYYQCTNYTDEAFQEKKDAVTRMLKVCAPSTVWDMGANTGIFSRLALEFGAQVVSFDIDPISVNSNYEHVRKNKETLLPLLMDLTTPSPAIGWNCAERLSVFERGPVDVCMALALIHHLVISNNVPLRNFAELFAPICKNLIIEFVPKEDSQVKRLLASRKDIFPHYDLVNFKNIFSELFFIIDEYQQKKSLRTLFLMKSKRQ
jgi:hypothetical protein